MKYKFILFSPWLLTKLRKVSGDRVVEFRASGLWAEVFWVFEAWCSRWV